MKKVILLLAGRKRSGKDSLANLIGEELTRLGKTVEIVRFADPMKKLLAITLDISLDELEDLKNDPEKPHRGYLQRLGSDAMKPLFGSDVWIKLARKTIEKSEANVVLVPDFRFPEEALVAKVTTLKVNRPSLKTDAADTHISEKALEDWTFTYTIENDGDLTDLRASALEIAACL